MVIPAFAVGRAQTLLYHLWQLRSAGRLPDIPVYLDSPMAINASDLLGTYHGDHRLPPDVYESMCAMATYTREAEQSMKISASREPKIVISASGMATGGRILHHLKAFAPDSRNTIMVTGYQVPGTRGAAIAAGERYVRIYGEWVPINAQVANLAMLSAHADADELVRWAAGFETPPRQVFVVHGEPQRRTPFAPAWTVSSAGRQQFPDRTSCSACEPCWSSARATSGNRAASRGGHHWAATTSTIIGSRERESRRSASLLLPPPSQESRTATTASSPRRSRPWKTMRRDPGWEPRNAQVDTLA